MLALVLGHICTILSVVFMCLLLCSYEARPYNFFIFPRPYCHQSPDEIFMCQVRLWSLAAFFSKTFYKCVIIAVY